MPLQVVPQAESDATCLADKRPFPRVDDPVLHQRPFQLERLAAFGAFERPFVRVHSLVRKQVSGRPETLPTRGAGEMFFTSVNRLVLLKDAFGGEALPAGITDKRPDFSMHDLVSLEQTHLGVRLLTNWALEGFFPRFVAQQVIFKILLESKFFVALVARHEVLSFVLHGVFCFVSLEVSLENLLLMETLPALVTRERLVMAGHVLLQLVSVVKALVAVIAEDSLLMILLLSPPVSLLLFIDALILLRT